MSAFHKMPNEQISRGPMSFMLLRLETSLESIVVMSTFHRCVSI
jgi:hypothetical protein